MKILFIVFGLSCISFFSMAQPKAGDYRGILYREDGKEVVFNMEVKNIGGQTQLYIINASERIQVKDLQIKKDSVTFRMPVFESEFKAKMQPDDSWKGVWLKAIAGKTQQWPFVALPGRKRFDASQGDAKNNISGRWAVNITRPNGTTRYAVAEFVQKGNQLTGTFLTPTGDYRYLHGIVTGNLLLLSTFDGAHAYTFSAKIASGDKMVDGFFGSGIAGKESWVAKRDNNAKPPGGATPQLKEGYSKLDFVFNDLDSNKVSINDDRFNDKVVIIQIMGSWCPNCLDETKFLSDYYNKNRNRGIEVVSLAYEYSTDFQRSQKSVRKFQQLFDVKYPMLITGVAVGDSLRTEKTLPQLTPIKAFPSTIFLGRDGTVREIHSSFYGPGSGKYYEEFKKEFYETVEGLLREKD